MAPQQQFQGDVGRTSSESEGQNYSDSPHQKHLFTDADTKMDKLAMVYQGGSKTVIPLSDAGYPGHLTEEQFEVFNQFRQEVYNRSPEFREALFSFDQAHEEEAYALCRWLRARKFKLNDVIKMIEEAVECRREPRQEKFYPDTMMALKVEQSLYLKQYPSLYYGRAKNGCPVFISQPGVLNIKAIECLTTLEGIINFHWNAMVHEFQHKLKAENEMSNGKFKRYECVCILDLKHLTSAQLSKRPLNITKKQSQIDSLCFPETLNRMMIINAPGFFTMTWKIMKGWVDARTVSKVDLIGTSPTKIQKKLKQYIDEDSLPSDYGGNGDSIHNILRKEMIDLEKPEQIGSREMKATDQETHLIHLRQKASQNVSVERGKIVKLSIFTRSISGCMLHVVDSKGRYVGGCPAKGISVQHDDLEEKDSTFPTRVDLEDYGVTLQEPDDYQVKLESKGGRFGSTGHYLVAVTTLAENDIPQEVEVLKVDDATKSLDHDESSEHSEHERRSQEQIEDRSVVSLSSRSLCIGMLPFDKNGMIEFTSPSDYGHKTIPQNPTILE